MDWTLFPCIAQAADFTPIHRVTLFIHKYDADHAREEEYENAEDPAAPADAENDQSTVAEAYDNTGAAVDGAVSYAADELGVGATDEAGTYAFALL